MKPMYVKVFLFDPLTMERFHIVEDIRVDIVRIETPADGESNLDALPLELDGQTGVFGVDRPDYETSRTHHFRIRFLKPNFSKSAKKLLEYEGVTADTLPIYCPARLPYWDSGWADYYNFNRFFGRRDVKFSSSPEHPLGLEVPIREMFVIGHRGAPYFFPENTIASFRRALDLGANGLEFDLCLTRDRKIAIFHDPEPIKFPGAVDRTMFEGLPFELVSPAFDITGREVTIKVPMNGQYIDQPPRPVAVENEFHICNLTMDQVRQYYHYALVDGKEHLVPDLEEFLDFVEEERDRLRFLFLDIKAPAGMRKRDFGSQFGALLASALKNRAKLPVKVVVCNERPAVLARLKRAIRSAGEQRCLFAFDASGGIQEFIGVRRRALRWLPRFLRQLLGFLLPYRYNPLEVARRMKNTVVSVGTLMRPAHLEEILHAVKDRDHNRSSPVEIVVHWTLNESPQFAESLSAGVNGIVTDKPDDLTEYLKSLGVKIVNGAP